MKLICLKNFRDPLALSRGSIFKLREKYFLNWTVLV